MRKKARFFLEKRGKMGEKQARLIDNAGKWE